MHMYPYLYAATAHAEVCRLVEGLQLELVTTLVHKCVSRQFKVLWSNYVCMSNSQLCSSPSTNLQTSVHAAIAIIASTSAVVCIHVHVHVCGIVHNVYERSVLQVHVHVYNYKHSRLCIVHVVTNHVHMHGGSALDFGYGGK